ncbi:glycosyl hydrolase 115 family protein [Teredinibacter haidensis]|uniref:glycosyl hydrolase 115 family protein n=1 Tax=Teredinibacter haidensis TaxID=2731755 RepID=UPI000948F199|nr:glycosyl hydrolase 115 family protein [Teredinibacter haidensis]
MPAAIRSFLSTIIPLLLVLYTHSTMASLGDTRYVSEKAKRGAVALVGKNTTATLYVDAADHKGVIRALGDLQTDIRRVSGKEATVVHAADGLGQNAVIAGTIGKSALIDQLIAQGKIDPSVITGKWDGFHLQTVKNPLPGVEQALVIAGADKRGTIYGIYDVSEQIGVSPWYYWADVPEQKKSEIYILKNTLKQEAPKVKYRGIFLNDEAPALSSWVAENHGNYNHEFYVKVFELLLRLKANFLWPAMWNNAFADDDPQNMILADEYGIVMSTSHHEPMMRADKEWNRYGEGHWDYARNPEKLADFWADGATRNKNYESIYTLGMRGQEDTPMSENENIDLLETIVNDQRKILSGVFEDRDISEVPQVWCLYKEVQSYYENGMRTPDDVILLWSDDNWGNIRRLPTPEERKRSGGAGVYYHFDYVGGPRSYRWINSTPIPKIWEQMNLAYEYEANQIWITNVGDLKPMEYPIEFFLTMAWDPERWNQNRLQEFGQLWAAREFGAEFAEEIEALMTGYTRHSGRRKAELMDANTYSLVNYDEADRIEAELKDLVARAEALNKRIPAEKKDAFFQLVLHPVKATATVTLLHIAVAKNRLYANQSRADANAYAELAKQYFADDAALKQEYHSLNNGKWNHFMNQPHLGYTNWNNPEGDQLPVTYQYSPGTYAEMGIAIEGGEKVWPDAGGHNLKFDQNGKTQHWLDVYNRGTKAFNYTLTPSADWIKLSSDNGNIETAERILVSIDWSKLPEGASEGRIQAKGPSWNRAHIKVTAFKPNQKLRKKAKGFLEADGYIAIEAASASRGKAKNGISWQEVPQHGRTRSSMTPLPIGDTSFENVGDAPYLEYDLTFFHTGEFELQAILAPSWPFVPGRGLRYAVAIGDEEPQIVDFLAGMNGTDGGWNTSVMDGVRMGKSKHKIEKAGRTTLRFYMVDPGVTVQKLIVNTGGLLPSYLGPEESPRK